MKIRLKTINNWSVSQYIDKKKSLFLKNIASFSVKKDKLIIFGI